MPQLSTSPSRHRGDGFLNDDGNGLNDRWRHGALVMSILIGIQLISVTATASSTVFDHRIRRRHLSLPQQQQQQQQGFSSIVSTKENSQQFAQSSTVVSGSQPKSASVTKVTTKDISQQSAPSTSSKEATTSVNVTAIGSPGSVDKTQSQTKPKSTKTKSTIAPSQSPGSTANNGGKPNSGKDEATVPPSSNGGTPQGNSNKGDGNEKYPTHSPTTSTQGHEDQVVTKYPEKQDEGSHTPDDEELKPPVTDDTTNKGTSGGKTGNMGQEEALGEENIDELEDKLKSEEKEARRIGGAGIGIALIAMIFTAHQMSENPDGIYASCCRLIITLVGCAFKIVLMPCRSLFGGVGGSRHYGHMPVNTMEYGYREPYSNVEMS